ncbi:nucleotidyl transferase AbiEii/AbiGii toxin family protein [Enterococcus alcedinis]|uniref:Abortive infection protein n=1 Tax=Enterococcus alcedinis TaxID=1274384 RepID=A0A917JGF7_9ENTE|nr:nucleotidyl transferase AbiEii/AbiGii toxin family protein [Enterococcus alcedinis]MBP2101792.1 hypothetical protein [Enterococcus alcedinis]GGI65355.1 abortive infection protein [Enterococcus alcedinis]
MNSNRLKDLIKNQNKNMSFEEYRIRYAIERFLSRLQISQYKENLILKGGFLLGTIFNIEQRTTKDLDTLISEIKADKDQIENVLLTIIEIDLNDNVKFELISFEYSQMHRIYDGFKAQFKMTFLDERTFIIFDLDLGVGDTITPEVQLIEIPLLFNEAKGEQDNLLLLCYPIATILAEKIETILTLGTKNSRMKDFYDIHLILNDPQKPNINELYEAFQNTWIFRHPTLEINEERFEDWYYVVDSILEDVQMSTSSWINYTKDRIYAQDLDFQKIILQLKQHLTELEIIYRRRTDI